MYMKRLPNIDLTEKEICYLEKQPIKDYGAESRLYEIPAIFGQNTVAKMFAFLGEEVIQNKFEKIKRLYQLEELTRINEIQILKSISYRGKLVGYLMNKSVYLTADCYRMTRKQQLEYLMLARQKLFQLEKLDILYGDISASNIMIGKNDICFCDLDNVAYQELPMDVQPGILEEFVSQYGKMDSKAVSYMFNFYTLKQLCFLDGNKEVEEYLEIPQIPREIIPQYYLAIKNQMRIITQTYEGRYFVDYIKPKYLK